MQPYEDNSKKGVMYVVLAFVAALVLGTVIATDPWKSNPPPAPCVTCISRTATPAPPTTTATPKLTSDTPTPWPTKIVAPTFTPGPVATVPAPVPTAKGTYPAPVPTK